METCSNCHNAPEMCNCLDKPGDPPEPRDARVIAEVSKRITGRIASFEVGEIVKVTHNDGRTCTIERETWRGSLVEICNRVVGVPVNRLKFLPLNSVLTQPDIV